MSRCSGHCCKAFVLNGHSLESLRAEAEAGHPDAAVWLPLVVPLGKHAAHPLGDEKIVGWSMTAPSETECEWFSCNALQPNGDCGVYGTDARPNCCSTWPYRGEPCVFVDCTWEEGRVPLISPSSLVRRNDLVAAADAPSGSN